MSASHIMVGLAVGVAIGAMDFSLAKSITAMLSSLNPRTGRAVILIGFIFRLGAVAVLLWTISRADNISFLAVCAGLTGSFTLLTLRQAVGLLGNTGPDQEKSANRR